MQQETPGVHPLWHIPFLPSPLNTVHADTVAVTWLAMALALIVVGVLAATHPITVVSKRYSVMELVVSYLTETTTGILGKGGVPYVPFIISLFVFILLLNEIGLFPLIGRSPTADLNTTAALAITSILLVQIVGIRNHGLGFYKHLVIKPLFLGIPMLPIMLIDELARPVTLAMRLFGNIFAGEVLLIVTGAIITAGIALRLHLLLPVGAVLLAFALWLGWLARTGSKATVPARPRRIGGLAAVAAVFGLGGIAALAAGAHGVPLLLPISHAAKAAPLVIYFFNLIIGVIQAVVFTLLTIAYLITPTQQSMEH
jgi:F-type H+-transporting ATPase subunit a